MKNYISSKPPHSPPKKWARTSANPPLRCDDFENPNDVLAEPATRSFKNCVKKSCKES